MPSIRRQSLPSASTSSGSGPSTPVRNPAVQALRPSSARPASPRSPRTLTPANTTTITTAPSHESEKGTRSTKASSKTPQAQTPLSHHHRTADELALEEGQEILSDIAPGSARAQRHARLIEAREEAEKAASLTSGGETEDEDETTEGTLLSDLGGDSAGAEQNEIATGEAEQDGDEDDESATVVGDTTLRVDQVDADIQKNPREEGTAASVSESSDSGSEFDSDDSGSDSDSESDSEAGSDDSEEDSDEEERLENLLQAAKITAAAKANRSQTNADEEKNDGEMVLQFDEPDKKEAPIPDIKVGQLPRPHIHFTADGSARASLSAPVLPSRKEKGKGKDKASGLELDNRAYERPLSKRERAAQPRKATVSDLWTRIPTARQDALQQMKRDYQALALANSLDPKRFMKGSAKSSRVPETFAIGTLVEQPRHLQDTTLTRDARYRPGQIVEQVARDEVTNTIAKRKYGDLQSKRMDNGRGRGWKKRTKW